MPRIAGQIDIAKNEAILDAAVDLLAERGLSAPLEEIARRAGVSKQTIYNHYGSKPELIRAIVERRVDSLTAPLVEAGADERPEATLTTLARSMLAPLTTARGSTLSRMLVLAGSEVPGLAQALYEAGTVETRRRLAVFLEQETQQGRLAVDDPMLAAEFFMGMAAGSYQAAAMLGVERTLTCADIDRIAGQAVARFMRAYAP